MANLLISKQNKRINSSLDVKDFESRMGVTFPDNLTQFILKYEGAKLDENMCYFEIQPRVFYEINQILYLNKSGLGGASIEQILEGHRKNGIADFIPFAIDSGGWDYNLGIGKNNEGQVWVNKFDSDEESTMFFVSPSLEEFVDGLKSDV